MFWRVFWRWKRIAFAEHCGVCPLRALMDKLLPGHHSGLCSAPQVSLWFWSGIAVGFLLLSHFLIQSESAFLPQGVHQGIIEGDFALCISLYHGYELLLQMGIRSLFIYLWGIMDGSKGEMSLGASFLSAPLFSFHFPRCMAGLARNSLGKEGLQVELVFCSPYVKDRVCLGKQMKS